MQTILFFNFDVYDNPVKKFADRSIQVYSNVTTDENIFYIVASHKLSNQKCNMCSTIIFVTG